MRRMTPRGAAAADSQSDSQPTEASVPLMRRVSCRYVRLQHLHSLHLLEVHS